jgi:hypothetical protein
MLALILSSLNSSTVSPAILDATYMSPASM